MATSALVFYPVPAFLDAQSRSTTEGFGSKQEKQSLAAFRRGREHSRPEDG